MPARRADVGRRDGSDARKAFAGLVAISAFVGLVAIVVLRLPATSGTTPPGSDSGMAVGPGGTAPGPGGTSAAAISGSAVTGNAANGEALYLQSCAACHGLQGAGTASGPAIANAGAALVDFVLRTGRMPLSSPTQPRGRKPPAFGEQQIADLVAYVSSLGNGPPIPNVTTSGADIAQGRALFIQNCASCHGAGGAGGAVGGNVVAPPLTQADPTTVGEAVTTGPGPMPVFSFSPQQLDSLAGYVVSLRNQPSPGGLAVAEIGPVAEGFLAGTIGVVTLLVVARWIAHGGPEDEETDGTDGSGGSGPTASTGGAPDVGP